MLNVYLLTKGTEEYEQSLISECFILNLNLADLATLCLKFKLIIFIWLKCVIEEWITWFKNMQNLDEISI